VTGAPQAFLGVDVGTQTTKAQVVGADGAVLAQAEHPCPLRRGPDGSAEQDPHAIEDSVLMVMSTAVAAAGDARIAALALAGQMGGAIGIGADFTPLTPYESWLDTRADGDRSAVLADAGQQILAANGIIPFIGPRVARWQRTHPGQTRRLAKVLAPAGYLAGRLTAARSAQDAVCDRTQAHLYGCLDVRAGTWRADLAATVGIPVHLLPRLADPDSVVGGLSAAAADRTGLPAGTPVCAGLGDGTAGWVAAGSFGPGSCVDTGGSSEHFAICVDRFHADPYPGTVLTCMPSALSGIYHLFGFTGGTGLTRRWWAEQTTGGDYEQLERAGARLRTDYASPLAVPHLNGRLSPFDADTRGALVGLDETCSPAHAYRAFIEAVAHEARSWLHRAASLTGSTPTDPYAVAIGGAGRSRLSARIKADVLGVAYLRMQPHVNAARGAAILAAAAVHARALDDPVWCEPARDVLDRTEPDPSTAEVYAYRARLYWALLDALAPIDRALAGHRAPTPSTWGTS